MQKIIAIIILLISIVGVSCRNFPFASYQFKYTPVEHYNNTASYAVSFTFFQPYDLTWKRQICLAGFRINQTNQIKFELSAQSPSVGGQIMSLTHQPSIRVIFISFYFILIENGNPYFSMSYTETGLFMTGTMLNRTHVFSNPVANYTDTTVMNFLISFQGSSASTSSNVGAQIQVQLLNAYSFSYQVFAMAAQTIERIKFLVLFLATTPYQEQNYAKSITTNSYFAGQFDSFQFFGISSIYYNDTIGGLGGNCILGLTNLQIGGSLSDETTSFYFNANNTPVNQTMNEVGTQPFFAVTLWVCFAECPSSTYFREDAQVCLPCLLNCIKCKSFDLCEKCNTTYGLNQLADSCESCNVLSPGCNTCNNQTYCYDCIANYVLNSSTNLCDFQCHITMINCLICSDPSFCTQCVNTTYFVTSNNLACLECAIMIPNCLTCLNESTCTACELGRYYLDSGACFPCSTAIVGCKQCQYIGSNQNSNIICTTCESTYYVNSSNQCSLCSLSIPNCVNCSSSTFCDNCEVNYIFNNSTKQCEPCSVAFVGCVSCNDSHCFACREQMGLSESGTTCLCFQGWIVQDQCTSIVGCVQPVAYSDNSKGCTLCDSTSFDPTPVGDTCQCPSGTTMLQTVCNSVVGCAVQNGTSFCRFCNITKDFQLQPTSSGQCVCKSLMELSGDSCVDICGDGFIVKSVSNRYCDDGNIINGDGCSSSCLVEVNFSCSGGGPTTASDCMFTGSQVQLQLNRIEKTKGQNQATFNFDVIPAIASISSMDFSTYVFFFCDTSITVNSMTYSEGIFQINAGYTTDLEGGNCSLVMSFDQSIIQSSSYGLSFIAQGFTTALTFVDEGNMARYKSASTIFNILDFIVLAVFALSFGHKMIGVQLLVNSQFVYLARGLYLQIPFMIEPVEKFIYITGYWLFNSNNYDNVLSPFTSKVKVSPYFLQTTFAVSLLVLLLLVIWIILQIKSSFQQEEVSQIFQQIVNFTRRILFMISAGFICMFIVASYLNNRILVVEEGSISSVILNSAVQLLVWIGIGIVLSLQIAFIFYKKNKYRSFNGGQDGVKGWYIPCFLFKNILAMIFFLIFISYPSSLVVAIILAIFILFFIFILICRPYDGILNNIGIYLCQLPSLFSVGLAFSTYITTFSDDLWSVLVFVLQGMIILASLLSVLRTLIVTIRHFTQKENRQIKEKEEAEKINKFRSSKGQNGMLRKDVMKQQLKCEDKDSFYVEEKKEIQRGAVNEQRLLKEEQEIKKKLLRESYLRYKKRYTMVQND